MAKSLTFAIFCGTIKMVEKIKNDRESKHKDLEGVTCMYNVGDKVVYPMHGAGVIDAIEEKEILG